MWIKRAEIECYQLKQVEAWIKNFLVSQLNMLVHIGLFFLLFGLVIRNFCDEYQPQAQVCLHPFFECNGQISTSNQLNLKPNPCSTFGLFWCSEKWHNTEETIRHHFGFIVTLISCFSATEISWKGSKSN